MNKDLKKSLTIVASDILKLAYDANEDKIKKHLSDSQFRKVRKLATNPELFIQDTLDKKKEQARKYLPIKYDGKFHYTIVSAVYNVGKYLDEYFASIVNQSLNFKKHIHIILVDDGSTDNSADIIKKWQKKYPKNIHYYYKENGGQASARNLGLQYVKTDWVTFIDPDDFVDVDYFKNTDEILSNNRAVKVLAANTIFYMESKNAFKDAHPLRYRFHQKDKKFAVKNLDKNINLSAAASIFASEIILQNQIVFDSKVKPNFEDGKFIGEFLLHAYDGEAWFADNVVYNYRKRDDGTSTLDGSWSKPEKFSNVLEYGFLALLNRYKVRFGSVPKNIQFTAMYDMYWYLTHLLNQPEKLNFLSEEQKQDYYRLYDEIMSLIDSKTIMDFGVAGAWFFHKVGFLGAFKGEKPPFQICYIESVDKAKQQVLISHFDYFDSPVSYRLNGQDIVPQQQKLVENTFNDKLFTYEKRAWIGYESLDEVLSIHIDGKLARLALGGLAHKPEYKIADIDKVFSSPKYQTDGSWLLMDRETKADDNAEHLYRHIQTHYPEQECYFALNRDSVDWDRLADDGFNLVAFGESDFEFRLTKADKIISSHIEAHIHNYFGDLYAGTKKFVFLQHGVTQNNLSRWLNGKKHLACFITTTKDEYRSIAMGEKYKFGEKETVLTGFPRHDALYRKNQMTEQSKNILIMPTWRSYLMGETVGKGANTRELNMDLLDSNYAQSWLSFLRSDKLQKLVAEHGYQVIFAPHANIEPYLPHMNLPSYLQIWSASKTDESMQDLFVRAELLITDYSSVAFEMAYIGKPTLYYQFDKDEFFSSKHSLQKGYFEYEQHGFGAVSYDEATLLDELESVLTNGVADKYQYRIDNTFEYQDDGNCERVYQAIKALDEPETANNLPILQNMIDQAELHQEWDLVAERIEKLLANYTLDEEEISLYRQRRMQALFEGWKYSELQNSLQNIPLAERLYWQAKMDLQIGNARSGAEFFASFTEANPTELAISLLVAAFHQDKLSFEKLSARFVKTCSSQYYPILEIAQKLMGESYFVALSLLKTYLEEMMDVDKRQLKLELVTSYIYVRLGNLQAAHQYLVSFEKHTQNDPSCRIAIARLAKIRGDFEKMFAQLNRAFEENTLLIPEDLAADYLKKMHESGNTAGESYLLKQFRKKYPKSQKIALYEANILYQNQNWKDLATVLSDFAETSLESIYLYTTALSRLKNGKLASRYFNNLAIQDTLAYWKLAAEVAEAKGDKDLQMECLRKQMDCLC